MVMLLVEWIDVGAGCCRFLNSWTIRPNHVPDGLKSLQIATQHSAQPHKLRVYKFI